MTGLLKVQIEDWQNLCSRLSEWEDAYLVDSPTPAVLAQHRKALDVLEYGGKIFSWTTNDPQFTDRATTNLVAMTLQDLKDRRALWHGAVPAKRRAEILKAAFNEP